MKKYLLIILPFILFSCNSAPKEGESTKNNNTTIQNKNLPELSFNELFKSIDAMEVEENVFKLFGRDFVVMTSGIKDNYNSMTVGYGGWGILFNDPTTWAFLRANRYTLEYVRENKTYTLSNFPEEYQEQVIYFGNSSGRDSDKMKNHKLTVVETPSGNITYKEANFIVECELTEITTVHPNDFYSEKGKEFIIEGFNEAKDYHKMVFGKITNIWVKK